MLKYLVILLDDSSVSYCHYESGKDSNLMPLDTLKKGILFAMKNDLKIQYVLPQNELPPTYMDAINSMFHDNIGSIAQEKISSVIVIDGMDKLGQKIDSLDTSKRYIVRTKISEFFEKYEILKDAFDRNVSVNIVYKDVETLTDDKKDAYSTILNDLGKYLKGIILSGGNVNTNLLTDRIALDEMNNCGAGDTTVALAPNGKFYPCPAFYYDNDSYRELGNIETGLNIRNKNLFTLKGSPLCRTCDAYHCKKCVWLNKKQTLEINIPSRQQCIMAHIERNASKELLDSFHQANLLETRTIDAIDYIDPFDVYKNQ